MNKDTAIQICGVCRAPKPKHFLVCEACWVEVPWNLKVEYWTAKGFHHVHPSPPNHHRFERSMIVIVSHLKQFGSALP